MKFSCDRCQTRYSIGDEKVRGKVLKIRCKTCGNIVVVREQPGMQSQAMTPVAAAAGAAPTTTGSGAQQLPSAATPHNELRAAQQHQQQQARADVDWYVAIKGKQHGPAKKDDVVRLYREGKITERTYLWNESMAAWTRLRDVAVFSFLVAEGPARQQGGRPPPPPPVDDHGGDGQGESRGAEIIPFDEAKRARDAGWSGAASSSAGVGPITNDPFAAVAGASPGADNAPRDSTRVFIMQAGLHNRGKKHRVYAAAAGAVVSVLAFMLVLDFQGFIEIPGLHRVVTVVTQRDEKPREVPTDMVAWSDAEEDPKLKCKLMPDVEKCVKETLAANEVRRRKRAAAAASGQDTTLSADNFRTGAPTGSGEVGRAGGAGKLGDISDPTEAARIASVFKNEEKKLTVPKLKIETATVPSGTEIDAKSVSKTIEANRESVAGCVEQAAKVGNVPGGRQALILSIEPNGIVSKARFASGPVNASPVGECIRGAARRWKFQPFPGQPADVEVPLILSVGM